MRSYDEKAKQILQKRDKKIKENEIKRKKAVRLSVLAAVIALTTVLTVVIAAAARRANGNNTVFPADTGVVTTNTDGTKKYNDGVIGENTGAAVGAAERGDMADGEGYYSLDKSSSAPIASPSEDSPIGEIYYELNGVDAVAGTLTAGEWKDADNIADWQKLLSKDSFDYYVGIRKLDTKNIITVNVKDGENACFNVTVKLLSGDETLYTAKTDINGAAYLFYDITGDGKKPDAVSVQDTTVSLDGKTEITVEAADAGIKVTALDLLLMIDTTGSMGDELEYIKAELNDVVKRISEADQSVSIRVSVNFYRDEGDEYVVKYYDFRTDINECLQQIKEQHADGGGDYPEAVHTALDNAVTGHEWRDEAVKICFIVLDAPPHSENEIQGVNSELLKTVKTAAEQGIRIIPVASSGVDEETEFLLRSYAILTGGTYVFITNDSGVGGDHKEAEVGEHTVEYLNECMIRIVCEYCGIYKGEKIPYTPTYHQ